MTRVAIVGGGFAGAVAGLWLQRRGVQDVRIFEARPAAGTTPCGEGLSASTLERLIPVFDGHPFVDRTFHGARWKFPGTELVIRQKSHTMAREAWIPAMLESFQGRGGSVEFGARLKGDALREMEAEVVIGCDGPGSQVRAFVPEANVQTTVAVQARVQTDADSEWLQFLTSKKYSPEYAWWFPRTESHNIGLLGFGDGKDFQRLDALLANLAIPARILRRETYPIGFGGRTVASPDGRYLLLGDAAGMTNPLTKGGMAAILHAAPILASAVAAGRPERYQTRMALHPLLSKTFQRALRLLRSWNDDVFRQHSKVTGPTIDVNHLSWWPALSLAGRVAMARPAAILHAPILARAGRLSLHYSW